MADISFDSLIPQIDQIVYSVCMYKYDMFSKIRNYFTSIYGEPLFNKKDANNPRYFYKKPELWLTMPDEWNWSTITFCPFGKDFDIEDFINYMRRFKSLRYFPKSKKPKRVQNLKSLEVAFDLPLWKYKPTQLLPVFFLITQHLLCKIPKYNYTYYKEYEDKKECMDGATNYNIICYWNSFKKNNILNGYKPKRNTKGAASKAYLKEYMGVWHIRFEITFKTNDLDNMFYCWMLDMPAHLPDIFEMLLQKKFKDFFSFVNIDYKRFMEYANSHKNLFIEKFIDDLNEEAEFNSAADKLYYMRIMARLLHETYLKNHIKSYLQPFKYKDFANFLKDYLPRLS